MTLTLDLPPDLESSLSQAANQQSLTVEEFAIQILTFAFTQKERQKKAVSLLQSWLSDADIEEQKTTGAYLIEALDQDRLSDRLLFPDAMKGKSW
jgi:acyl-homoserine lactone acylase PvdQ